jgi:hypothetical protein
MRGEITIAPAPHKSKLKTGLPPFAGGRHQKQRSTSPDL